MGLDIERIIEKDTVIDHLICSICMDVLENPKQAPCQHSFCNDCIREWLDSGNHTCPVDRQELSVQDLNQPRLLQDILNNLTLRCKNYQKGCSLLAKYADRLQLIEHETENCSILNHSFRSDIDKLKKNLKALEKKISEKDKIIGAKEQENKTLLEAQKKFKVVNEMKIKNLNEEVSSKDEQIKTLEKILSSCNKEGKIDQSDIVLASSNPFHNKRVELPNEILEVRNSLTLISFVNLRIKSIF